MSTTKTTNAKPLRFAELWNKYPHRDPCVNPRTGDKAYDNQCAIRVGMALEQCGVSFANFPGPRCEFGPPHNGMVLRAEELARWLRTKPFKGCPLPAVMAGKGFKERLQGRTGIVFFKDYWLRAGEKHATGDHIDLWNKDRLTPSVETFFRFTLGISRVPSLNPLSRGNWYSDLENSQQVLFWMIS